jgi:tetratricopeptide (TPR) repeat protein
MRIPEMKDVMGRAAALMTAGPMGSNVSGELEGEFELLRALHLSFAAPSEGKQILDHAKKAERLLPRYYGWEKVLAMRKVVQSYYRLIGDFQRALNKLFDEMKRKSVHGTPLQCWLLTETCWVYWTGGDLSNMQKTAEKMLELGKTLDLPDSIGIGRYALGISHYCRNDLDSAEKYLTDIEKSVYKINVFNFAHGAFAHAVTCQAQGRANEATEIADFVVRHAMETGNIPLLQLGHAFQAEMALRQGDIAEASKWAKDIITHNRLTLPIDFMSRNLHWFGCCCSKIRKRADTKPLICSLAFDVSMAPPITPGP